MKNDAAFFSFLFCLGYTCHYFIYLQAIAIACCFMDKGSILIICPAILRFSWAEELEHWLPILLPTDIHLGILVQFPLNLFQTILVSECFLVILAYKLYFHWSFTFLKSHILLIRIFEVFHSKYLWLVT